MKRYGYRAISAGGVEESGSMEADGERSVYASLEARGYTPVSIEEEAAPARRRHRQASLREQTSFAENLAAYIEGGFPLTDAMEVMGRECPDPKIRKVYDGLLESLRGGRTLSAAMKESGAFRDDMVGVVKAGESGDLPSALQRFGESLVSEIEMRRRVTSALVYPGVTLVAGVGVVIFLLSYVVPGLMELFDALGQSLPLETRIMLGIASFVRKAAVPGTAALLAMGIAVKKGLVSFRIPFFARAVDRANLSVALGHLAVLIDSGVPLIPALGSSGQMDPSRTAAWANVAELIQKGSTLSAAMAASHFPEDVTYTVSLGERSGSLSRALKRSSAAQRRSSEALMGRISSLVEPLLILVIGAAVGFIVLSMLSPIFAISATVG